MRSPCPRPYIAAAVAINTTVPRNTYLADYTRRIVLLDALLLQRQRCALGSGSDPDSDPVSLQSRQSSFQCSCLFEDAIM